MTTARKRQLREIASALETLHGAAISRVLPKIAGIMRVRDLSFSQMTAIMHVFLNGPTSIGKIAAAADVTHTAASRMVDRLVKAGFMTRTEDPDDRRQKLVGLTPLGATVPPEWRAFTLGAYMDVLESFPNDGFQDLLDAVRKVGIYIPQPPEAYYDHPENINAASSTTI